MPAWFVVGALALLLIVGLAAFVDVRRHSPSHVTAQLAIGGRGLFFSRTPDGIWWKLRLRARRCSSAGPPIDPPPDPGVREPRRPAPPGAPSAVALDS